MPIVLPSKNMWPHQPELSNIYFPWSPPQVIPQQNPCSIRSIHFEYLERYALHFVEHSEDGFQEFYPFPWLYVLIAPQIFLNELDHFSHFWIIFCAVSMTSQWNILTPHSFRVSTMGVIASLAFLMFSLCVESNTLFIGTYLPRYSSRNLVSKIWLFLCVPVEAFWCFLSVFTAVSHVWYGFFVKIS